MCGKDGDSKVAFEIDTDKSDVEAGLYNGVQNSDGDGSVNLASLGYMCVKGWQGNRRHNPAGIPIKTKEYKHKPIFSMDELPPDPLDIVRGGGQSADHVDIMGNVEMISDILRLVTRTDSARPPQAHKNADSEAEAIFSQFQERFYSRIKDFSEHIHI